MHPKINTAWKVSQYRFFFLVRISPYSVRIQENTDRRKLHTWAILPKIFSTSWCIRQTSQFLRRCWGKSAGRSYPKQRKWLTGYFRCNFLKIFLVQEIIVKLSTIKIWLEAQFKSYWTNFSLSMKMKTKVLKGYVKESNIDFNAQ